MCVSVCYRNIRRREDKRLIIPEFLPKLENGTWIQTIQQCKDQISVYWIPYDFNWIKTRQEQLIDEMSNYGE